MGVFIRSASALLARSATREAGDVRKTTVAIQWWVLPAINGVTRVSRPWTARSVTEARASPLASTESPSCPRRRLCHSQAHGRNARGTTRIPSAALRRSARAWFVALWLAIFATASQAQPTDEYQIKAVFLFNFAQFVEWPAESFADSHSPLVIGVLGRDPFGPHLDDVVAGESINQRPLLIRRFRRVEEIETCHVLFIAESENTRLEQILAHLTGRSILTVGDGEDFARRGGVIRFLTEKNKIRFRINLTAAKAGNLIISSKVLRSAEVIMPPKND